MAHGQVAGLEEPELQEIHKLCLPEQDERFNKNTLRPERPEYATLMRTELNPCWIRSLRTIQRAIFNKLDVPPYGFVFPNGCLFLISTAAILFDQECSSAKVSDPRMLPPLGPHELLPKHVPKVGPRLQPLFEHMLLVDYGFGEHPLKESILDYFKDTTTLPDVLCFGRLVAEFAYDCGNDSITKPYLFKASKEISKSFWWRSDRASAEFAIMAYWLYTRRREISPSECKIGLTGYTGVLQEMVSEIPEKGAGRLRRKLSIDVNELIPAFASDYLKELLIGAARALAAQYGSSLTASLENEGGVTPCRCSCGTHIDLDGSSSHLGCHASRPISLSPGGVTPPPSYEETMKG